MDKRTLIFFLLFSLSLFGVNAFFSYYDQHKNQEWYAQQQAKKVQKLKQLEEDISVRTASPSTFPVMDLYTDEQAEHFLGRAVESDGHLLLSQNNELPKNVFARKVGSTESPLPFEAVYLSPDGLLSIYAQDPKKPLAIASLPEIGLFDLQIVFLPADKTQVLLGEFRDSTFSIPLSKIPEKYNQVRPKDNGIVFLKSGTSFLPVGIYEYKQGLFQSLENIHEIASFVSKPTRPTSAYTETGKPEEKFFVLQNNYQQLVFSNYGGAVVEINLPFQTPQNRQSIVKEIGFDRQMVEKHPQNARFPSHGFYSPGLEFHSQGQLGGYYPLLRRDLIERPPYKTIRIKPENYALNIVSEYPEVAELVYEVKQFDDKTIVFEAVSSIAASPKPTPSKKKTPKLPIALA